MTDEQAKKRLLTLTLVKLVAAAMIIFGLLNVMRPDWILSDTLLGRIMGTVFMLTGLADLLVVPKLLKKSWDLKDKL
jgi:hypothetical protein